MYSYLVGMNKKARVKKSKHVIILLKLFTIDK